MRPGRTPPRFDTCENSFSLYLRFAEGANPSHIRNAAAKMRELDGLATQAFFDIPVADISVFDQLFCYRMFDSLDLHDQALTIFLNMLPAKDLFLILTAHWLGAISVVGVDEIIATHSNWTPALKQNLLHVVVEARPSLGTVLK